MSEPFEPFAPLEPSAPLEPCEPFAPSEPWVVWQLADSAFPTGGFAHSLGLEAAWQAGEVPDEQRFRQVLRDVIGQAGHAHLPLVSAAHEAPARLSELDALCDVFVVNPVANRASRVQGRALLSTCSRVWPSPAIEALRAAAAPLCGHQAPLLGALFAALGVPLLTTQRLALFMTARGVLSAAVRLGLVGPYAAQRLQVAGAADLAAVLARCRDLREDDLAQTAPLLDILQAGHDRLYSRLFQS
jgi:urease accessory protein